MQGVTTTPIDAVANLRRSMIVATVLGLASTVVLSLVGHPLMGVLFCVGLALGAVNNRMLQLSVLKYGESEKLPRAQFTRRVLARLGLITAVAFAFALFLRPDGLGIFVGLAVFHVLMLIGASVPVFRSLRQPVTKERSA